MEFLSSLLSIILIDIVLSGDNAIVIGMAAHGLPPERRRIAIVGGVTVAVVLRVLLTLIATFLLGLPYLRIVGGVLLVWVAFRLLQVQEEETGGIKQATTFFEAMMTIVVADFVMSLDNVLGVAGAAHGDSRLLLIGLAISMALMAFAGSVMASLMGRFWWLAYVGAAVIAWVGGEMVLRDPTLESLFSSGTPPTWLTYVVPALTAVLTVAAAHWIHRRPHKPEAPPPTINGVA